MIDFVSTINDPHPGFLINGAQEILDDFLVGDTSRSDDAWGMIRADASNNSKTFLKVKLPQTLFQVSGLKEIDAVKKVLSRIQRTAQLFVEESNAVEPVDDQQIEFVVELVLEEGSVGVKLGEGEIFKGHWEGVEGTLIVGVAGGEVVGVVDVTKLQIDVISPRSPRKVLHESISRVQSHQCKSYLRETIQHHQLDYGLSILEIDKL